MKDNTTKRVFFYSTCTVLLTLLGLTITEYQENVRILDKVQYTTNRQVRLIAASNERNLRNSEAKHFAIMYNMKAEYEDKLRLVVDAYNKALNDLMD